MTPEQAIRAAKIIKPRVLYPYHYGETDIHKVKDGLKMRQAQKYVSGLCNKIYVNNQKVAENILT